MHGSDFGGRYFKVPSVKKATVMTMLLFYARAFGVGPVIRRRFVSRAPLFLGTSPNRRLL